MVMHVRGSNWRFTSKLTFSQERHCDCLYQNYTAFLQNLDTHILGLSNEVFFVFVAFFVLAQSQSEFKKPKIFDWNFGKIAWWRGSKKIDLPWDMITAGAKTVAVQLIQLLPCATIWWLQKSCAVFGSQYKKRTNFCNSTHRGGTVKDKKVSLNTMGLI